MGNALQENHEILLHEVGTEKEFQFRILETVGMGTSCIVYTAVYQMVIRNS